MDKTRRCCFKKETTSRSKNKRNDILNVLNNLESVFTGVYLHYDNKPLKSVESIAERRKLRRHGFDEIAKKEKMISSEVFEKYFGYLSPSDMYKALSETKATEENKTWANTMEKRLTNLMEVLKSNPTSDPKKN